MFSKFLARSDRRDLASLDVLRGVAILLVLVSHFLPADAPLQSPIRIAFANAGVILFFFLSGFLMDRTFAQDSRIIRYLIRRAFRILPMYWVSIAIIFAKGTWTPRDVVANATFATQIMHVARMSGVYWTLYIEVLFYALVPILWLLGRRAIYSAPIVLMAAFTMAWLAGTPISDAPFYLVYCLTGMLFGAWYRKTLSEVALAISIGAVVIGSSILPSVSAFLGLAPLLCALLLYVALRFPFQFFALEIAGRVSYSWYLLHTIFGYGVAATASAAGINEWVAALAGIAVSCALSAATYLCIEGPMNELARGFIKRETKPALAPT
jgi:peptidoglycan/LPS O-acetylase OafA/YrhL